VALIPLIGHEQLRDRLNEALARGTLPASLLLYGPAGIGKERLAIWLGMRLLCETPDAGGNPCGTCQNCSYAERGAHPDIHWYFPRGRSKDTNPDVEDVLADYAESIGDRLKAKGPWPPADPMDGIYLGTILAIIKRAALTPALAKRKVIIVADADRMVSQEGSDQAANAFLKLLEEPPSNATIILTTSMRAALLPTIRSRVSSVRVAPPSREAAAALTKAGIDVAPPGDNMRARALLNAALGSNSDRYRAAISQGARGARGGFSEALDALVVLLNERAREASVRGDDAAAAGAARGVAVVEQTRRIAYQNVNPQALTARLLRDLAPLLG
jgi:DNA polymerase-3 subunit delta'